MLNHFYLWKSVNTNVKWFFNLIYTQFFPYFSYFCPFGNISIFYPFLKQFLAYFIIFIRISNPDHRLEIRPLAHNNSLGIGWFLPNFRRAQPLIVCRKWPNFRAICSSLILVSFFIRLNCSTMSSFSFSEKWVVLWKRYFLKINIIYHPILHIRLLLLLSISFFSLKY